MTPDRVLNEFGNQTFWNYLTFRPVIVNWVKFTIIDIHSAFENGFAEVRIFTATSGKLCIILNYKKMKYYEIQYYTTIYIVLHNPTQGNTKLPVYRI